MVMSEGNGCGKVRGGEAAGRVCGEESKKLKQKDGVLIPLGQWRLRNTHRAPRASSIFKYPPHLSPTHPDRVERGEAELLKRERDSYGLTLADTDENVILTYLVYT